MGYSPFNNIKADIDDLFNEFSIQESIDTIDYIYQSFNSKPLNRSFETPQFTSSFFEDEWLTLVALLYNRKTDRCLNCFAYKMQRTSGRRSFQCTVCSHQYYPTAGTIFHKTSIPLRTWFIIMKNMSTNNFSIKDIERKFGMCYKTAHRIYHLLKKQNFYLRLKNQENNINYQFIKDEIHTKIEVKPHKADVYNREKNLSLKILKVINVR